MIQRLGPRLAGGTPVRVYADLFILVNVTVNGLLLYGTAVLSGTRLKPWRAATAALLGAAYATAALWFPAWRSPAGVTVAAAAMLATAFWPVPVRTALAQAGLLVTLSAVTAGLALAWGGMAGGHPLVGPAGGWPEARIWFGPAAAGLAAAGAGRLWAAMRRRARLAAGAVDVEVEAQGGRAVLRGRLDTANDAAEPLSGRPVILASAESLNPLLGGAESLTRDPFWAPRFRLVPVRGLGGTPMLLPAIRVDVVRLQTGGTRLISREALIALYPGRIDAAGGWDAVVPPALLETAVADDTHHVSVS